MRIAVNATLYQPDRSGVERAIAGTVRGLLGESVSARVLTVFASRSLARETGPLAEKSGTRVCPVRYSTRLGRILREQLLVHRHHHDVWHFLGYVMPLLPPRGRKVLSVYDIIALTHPELCTRANRLFYGIALPGSIRAADAIVVPSNYVKQRIAERFRGTERKIRVLPLPLPKRPHQGAASARDTPPPDLSAREHLLFVSGLGPKKNLIFLLDAYARLSIELRERFPLLICGQSTARRRASILRKASRLGIGENVRFPGYVSDAEIFRLYRRAALLLYPSLEEGYGYPPLEAMAQGTPAVVSDRGSLPEIAGTAGARVCPLEPDAFASAITEILENERAYPALVRKVANRQPEHTWRDYAHALNAIYEEVCG